MRPHANPNLDYQVNLDQEIRAIHDHAQLDDRKIPDRSDDNVIIATWNLTNFGEQDREDSHIAIMAEVMRSFDIIAVQEIAEELDHWDQLLDRLGPDWEAVYTDVAGNRERLGYIYRRDRIQPTGLVAEVAMRGYERARIVIADLEPEEDTFPGFNRNPYIAGFWAESFTFYLVNVHLYWSNMVLRELETKALAKWAKSRLDKAGPPKNDIILIGDFNMPEDRPGDTIYDQLTEYGLRIPKHSTNLVGTNLAGENDYDQIVFFPSRTNEDFTDRMGVFDFDNAVFKDLWEDLDTRNRRRDFFKYIRWAIADHRPLWAEFKRNT